MEEISFSGLVMVAAVALLAPLLLGLAPRLGLPSVVLEIVAGIVIGPALLGWVETDTVIRVFALFGLAYLLFLAGLEIDLERLRGRSLRVAGIGFALSFLIALGVGYGLEAAGQVENGLIVAIILSPPRWGWWCPSSKTPGRSAVSSASSRSRPPRSPTLPP